MATAPAHALSGGAAETDSQYAFLAKVQFGERAGCTGALVDPEWVVTATACFATGAEAVPAGPPVLPTTVTVGRTNLASTAEGQVRTVAELVPRSDRNVVLAKLSSPVRDVTPIKVSTTAPVAGETLVVAGYGRTATEWVPDRLHTGIFAVQGVTATAVDIASDATASASICKGDAGGPALRGLGASFELVALNDTSWQAGCLAETETQNGATEARLDDIEGWIRQTVRGGNFVRLATSAQVLDTRSGLGAAAGARAGGSTTTFQVTGVGGVPATGVTAVLVDVTAINTTSATYLTLFPDGTPRDTALSMVNTAAGQTISNSAVVSVPMNGKLSVYNNSGSAHIAVDVQGYYTTAANAGGGFVPVEYTRLVDTRSGLGGSTGSIPGGSSRTFTLTGDAIPAGAGSAFLDVIVTGATGQGWIGAFPPGGTNNRSVMDFVPGTTSHGVAVQLSSDGRATFTNNSGSAIHLVLTATGYYTTSPATGAGMRTVTAKRVLDTRSLSEGTPVAANGTVDVPLGLPTGTAALVNLTVVRNTASGYLRAWPVDGTQPTASLTSYPAANTSARSGLAVVKAGTDGKIRIRNYSSGTVHILADLQGWFGPAAAPTSSPLTMDLGNEVSAASNGGSTVEDYSYPGAEEILATQNVRLISGDGHILLVDCATAPEGDLGLLKVYTTDEQIGADGIGRVCFKVTASSGWLNLEVPGVYEIRGDGLRTGTGHEVTAQLRDDEGEQITVDVDPDGSTQVGLGTDPNASPTMLLRLTVTG
ncbi:trypsin-like serine protease [Streptomyces sp. NPDC002845]